MINNNNNNSTPGEIPQKWGLGRVICKQNIKVVLAIVQITEAALCAIKLNSDNQRPMYRKKTDAQEVNIDNTSFS